jgi:hypothetical protein
MTLMRLWAVGYVLGYMPFLAAMVLPRGTGPWEWVLAGGIGLLYTALGGYLDYRREEARTTTYRRRP